MMSTPTLIHGMANAEYHAHASISSSQLKDVLRSPAHFYAKYVAPDREVKQPTDSMILGSAVHALFLEPDIFDDEFATSPVFDRRTKAGKQDFVKFQAESYGKTILTPEQKETAQRMASSLVSHPVNQIIMQGNGFRESSIFYVDMESGLDCRVRPDYHIPPCEEWVNGLVLDLKTCDDARPAAFARSIANFNYHTSAAMYCDGFQAYYNTPNPPDYIWLVIERDRPFACAAYQADEAILFIGHSKKRQALELIADCKRMNQWPSYSPRIESIALPAWAI